MTIEIIEGDILDVKVQYIAQQCNATHNRNFGLSSLISKKYPYANIYNGRYAIKERKGGDIIIRGENEEQKVICLIGQINQGKPNKKDETKESRERLFDECLEKIFKIEGLNEIAFPYGIGCGYGGGDWCKYLNIITKYSENNLNIKIKIIKKI
jgi:O-acetyl-ADP-ribose deacetylase (regulator of RNase III)